MGDDFDPHDFDAPRRDLGAFFTGLSKAIRNDERGYQAGLRAKAAAILAAYYYIADDFPAYLEMIEHECFAGDKKVHALNINNYQKHLAKCVVKRSFFGSGAFAGTLSKFTTSLKYLVALEVEPEACARTIKQAGGFKDFYELAVAAKREGKAPNGSDAKGSVPKARSRSEDESTSDDTDDDAQDDDAQDDDEAATPRGTRPKASVETITVKYILDNYLLVKMPSDKALDRYRGGPFDKDERRGLEIAYDGKGPNNLEEWAFVSELELEGSDAPEEDNDNDTDDDEEEDAA